MEAESRSSTGAGKEKPALPPAAQSALPVKARHANPSAFRFLDFWDLSVRKQQKKTLENDRKASLDPHPPHQQCSGVCHKQHTVRRCHHIQVMTVDPQGPQLG